MAAWTEVASNGPRCGEKPLGVARGFEPAHRSLSLARWLVGVLRPIVEAFVLSVLHAGQHVLFGCCIARQLVSNQHAWYILTPLAQFAEELFGRTLVPATLNQDI